MLSMIPFLILMLLLYLVGREVLLTSKTRHGEPALTSQIRIIVDADMVT